MAEKKVCDGCKQEYWWPAGRWQHRNCDPSTGGRKEATEGVVVQSEVVGQVKKVGRPRVVQDWKAHRREYMRRYRASRKV